MAQKARLDSVVTIAKASERSRPHARQSRHRPPTGVPAGCGHMVIGLGVKRGVGVRVGVRVRVDARVGVRVGFRAGAKCYGWCYG